MTVATRRLPVRPHLAQLEQQAAELLAAARASRSEAVDEFARHAPACAPPGATLDDAREVVAKAHGAQDWARLADAVRLADAIWNDDPDAVRALVDARPALLHEHVLIRTDSNWGPPMTYAANLGRDRIIRFLRDRGATDLAAALGRAALQGQIATAELLYEMAGGPPVPGDALGGPAYTLNVEGTAVMLRFGAAVVDGDGRRLAPVDVVLQTDGRNPGAKHAILEMYAAQGLVYPDTPVMALHRGRLDLLERHLERDPGLLTRTFAHREIYPAEMGCGDPLDATVGTPLDGTTLLHMCVEYDELEIARWLLDRGMDANLRARVGPGGFGGYTPLFHTVVSQPNFWMNYSGRGLFAAPFAELLLERGADPNARASIWKRLHPGHGDPARHDYRDVTPLSWGRQFHAPVFVSEPALRLIEAAGGTE
jgi:ankyrin repeat protein